MDNEEGGSSLLAVIAVVVFLVLFFVTNYEPEDFEVPPQFAALAEVFEKKCQSVTSDCKAVFQDGSSAVVTYNRPLLGPQILIHPDVRGEKINYEGLGRFFRDGGLILFDPADSYW